MLLALLVASCAAAQAEDGPPVRLRGAIESYSPPMIVFKERGGATLNLLLPEDTGIVEVIPSDVAAIQPGSYVGTATIPRPDGKLQSLEVVVFPEAARGSSEGHYPWDLKPDTSMTNATVADLSRVTDGRMLTLRYKGGEKTVIVPPGVPVVTLRPGTRALIVAGAKAFVVADVDDQGRHVVRRLLIGRNGLQPPM